MSSAVRSLLLMSFATWAIAGCVNDASSTDDLQTTEQSLKDKGVYYLQSTETADTPIFTFYDQSKVMIGEGQISHDSQLTEIRWRGSEWTDGDAVRKNGVVVGSDGADAQELDGILSVFELSLNGQVHPNACGITPCRVPTHRCTGACTGFVCSQQNGTVGFCINPN